MAKNKKGKKDQGDNIVVGIHYELPDGRIAYTYGFNGPAETIMYRLDDDKGGRTATYAQLRTWKPRRDLEDFPNARDPRLPYEFDLHWDIKWMSQLKWVLENGTEDVDAIRKAMARHNIVCE